MTLRMLAWMLLCAVCAAPAYAATELMVTSAEDNQGEGTLRTIVHYACDTPGDEIIRFYQTRLSEIRIPLEYPLVIPADCHGTVTIIGSAQVETILDAGKFADRGRTPGDNCTLDIYSDGHTVKNFTFSGNTTGAGACLFGNRNRLEENRFDTEKSGAVRPNRYGVIVSDIFTSQHPAMLGNSNVILQNVFGPTVQNAVVLQSDQNTAQKNTITGTGDSGVLVMGAENLITENNISGSIAHGLWVQSDGSIITHNEIFNNGGCPPPEDAYLSQPPGCAASPSAGGAGIYIANGSHDIRIGGPKVFNIHTEQYELPDANQIHYNRVGGVVFAPALDTARIHITHNVIAENYGERANVDFEQDGITWNDLGDIDTGPNTLFNYTQHIQLFPLVGTERYWTWGVAFDAHDLEVYETDANEFAKEFQHGGGSAWLKDTAVVKDTFAIDPEKMAVSSGHVVTTLVNDTNLNSSEFSLNLPVGADEDVDGIIDANELGGANAGGNGSAPNVADTDGDNLPDSVEDENRNGTCDSGETCADLADTDGDGMSDWAETHGDGHYDAGIDTDPLLPDMDGDALFDGEEDTNHNGIWETDLGETSPFLADSDGDGFNDNIDTCPVIPNPGQEPWFCEAVL